MKFEWDEEKNQRNFEKHGLYFEYAQEIFNGPVLTQIDSRKDYGEVREISLGMIDDQILFVVHTQRSDRIRLISARKANRQERKTYYDYLARGTTEDS